MTYPQVVTYLNSFVNYEKTDKFSYYGLKLARMKGLLEILGNPQDKLQVIHIAGTKGKGSTSAFIAYILRQAGYKTALYTSPHLSDFRERIRILNHALDTTKNRPNNGFEGMICKDELVKLVEDLKPIIDRYNKTSGNGGLSFFEAYTALALVYFKQKKVDFAVLETGLGGRLDATNVTEPLVCAITPVSYDHTQKLGNTLKEIAAEKAGIIKSQKVIVISARQEKEAGEVIRDRCRQVGARVYEVGREITCQKTKDNFSIRGIFGRYSHLKINLLGDHQLMNAAVSIGVIEALMFYNINVDVDSIKEGLFNTVWPGRCEVISRDPLVVLDGAQNVASICVLKKAIKENFKYKRLILVLGISRDKDIKGICNKLSELTDVVILTRANNPRATEPEDLADYFNEKEIFVTHTVKKAKAQASNLVNKGDLILVCGSLFVVGEFRSLI